MCIAMFWMEIRVGFPNSPVLQKHLCAWFNGCDITFLHLWVFSEMLHKPVFCLWARFLINFDDNHTETDGTWHFCLFYVNDPWGAAVFVWSDYLRGLLFSSLYLSRVFFFFFLTWCRLQSEKAAEVVFVQLLLACQWHGGFDSQVCRRRKRLRPPPSSKLTLTHSRLASLSSKDVHLQSRSLVFKHACCVQD